MENYILPDGFCVFEPILNSSELNKLYDIFGKIFSDYRKLDILYFNQENRGLTYLFTGDDVTQYSEKTLEFIRGYNTELYELLYKIIDYIMEIYCIDTSYEKNVSYFLGKMQIIFLKYEKNDGIWLHVDNVARYDQGPIITMSIGPEKIYFDLTPSLLFKNKELVPIRVELNNGDLVVMDGSSRIEWAHGLPYNSPYTKTKYSILFKFDKFGEQNKFYNDTLDTYISTSKILCNYKNK